MGFFRKTNSAFQKNAHIHVHIVTCFKSKFNGSIQKLTNSIKNSFILNKMLFNFYATKKHWNEKAGVVFRSQWQWISWFILYKGLFCETLRAQVHLVQINGELGFQNKECLYCSEGKQQFLQLFAWLLFLAGLTVVPSASKSYSFSFLRRSLHLHIINHIAACHL